MIMKWLMGDQQQAPTGTTPAASSGLPTPPPIPPANPAPQAQTNPRVVFVEATEPATTPALPTLPTPPAPPEPVTPVPAVTPVISPTPPAIPTVDASPSPKEDAPAGVITINEHSSADAGDLLSQALNSSMEAPTETPPPSFTPTPSSITPLVEKETGTPETSPLPEVKKEEIPGPATFVVPPAMPASTPPTPEVKIEEITPKLPPVTPPEEHKEEEKPETTVEPPKEEAPVVMEKPEVRFVEPQTAPVATSYAPEDSPDLPDVSSDIKRILQERWITLANEELSKLEKRHAEISGSLVELEREQQELMAKKLKLETEQVQVEKGKKGWEYKKGEAQTMLDKVVQEVSGL